MTTFLLLPGAGGEAWYWHLVAERLTSAGHRAVAVDLPADDESTGLAEYADLAVAALAGNPVDDLVVVAQSLGGFTGPLLCGRLPVRLLVLVNAMVPVPGESPADWWENTGHHEAIADQGGHSWSWENFDLKSVFLHDVPAELVAEMMARGERQQSEGPFGQPWPPAGYEPAWPDVPTRFLQGRDDRFFPLEFQRRVVAQRLGWLGVTVDELPGGHLNGLSQPDEVAKRLLAYHAELSTTTS